MKRNRYCYCNVCSNKAYNDKQILICNKSGHIPDFGITCNNYQLDETECKNVENKLIQEIEKKVKRPDFIEEINLKTELFEKEKCQDYMNLPESMIFKKESYTFLIIVAIVFVLNIPVFIEEKVSVGFFNIMVPILVLAGWLLKRSDIKEFNTLILTKEGIQYNDLEYPWDDIMTTHIQRHIYKRLKNKSFDKFLILGLKSGKIVKSIDIKGMRLSNRWWKLFSYPLSSILGHYVELYKIGFDAKKYLR
jgi:hypothetical protein